MKILWTLWRMKHVLGNTSGPQTCLFEPEGSSISARKDLLLYRDPLTVVADIRTISEHIDATFEKLLPDFLDLYNKNNA